MGAKWGPTAIRASRDPAQLFAWLARTAAYVVLTGELALDRGCYPWQARSRGKVIPSMRSFATTRSLAGEEIGQGPRAGGVPGVRGGRESSPVAGGAAGGHDPLPGVGPVRGRRRGRDAGAGARHRRRRG